jgi:hypothetical protein
MRFLTIAMLVAVSLAGCAGEATPAANAEGAFDDFTDVEVDSTTGVIRGLVVDNAIVPIADATVAITGQDMTTTTNENGAFLFSGLEAGNYFLKITKPGYGSVQQNVAVVAGVEKPAITRVLIEQIPGSEPVVDALAWSGFLGCSMRYFIEGRTCPGADTIWTNHAFIVDYELEKVPTYVVSEMRWENSQTLGGEMSYNIRRDDTSSDTTDIEGTSPLSLTVDEQMATDAGFGVDSPLRIIVFTAHLQETEPPAGGLWGLGMQIDQRFDTYTHVFYNYAPPEDWRFISDGEAPAPGL